MQISDRAPAGICMLIERETSNAPLETLALENTLPDSLYNIGSGKEISIKDLAETIQKVIGHEGKIIWDLSKPNGTPRKLMDNTKINYLGWEYNTELNKGIEITYEWLKKNIKKIKEVKYN